MSRFRSDIIHTDVDDIQDACNSLKNSAVCIVSPKIPFYITLFPKLITHSLYATKTGVNERQRVLWSRFQLSVHSLAIEEACWSRRGEGRPPAEGRMCSCGDMQTEEHVFEYCPRSLPLHQ